MNPFGIIGIIIGVTNLSIGILVYIYDRNNLKNQLWMVFALSVSIWGFGSYIISVTTDFATALIWWRITLMGVILIPFSFLAFTYSFLEKRNKLINLYCIIACSFFLIANCTPYFISSVHWMFNSFYYNDPTVLHSLFTICFVATISYSICVLFYSAKTNLNPNKRKQILIFAIASLVGAAGGSTCFLQTYSITLYPYLNASIILFPFIIGYAISRHYLFSIRLITIELVTFALWVIILIRTLLASSARQLFVEGSLFVVALVFGILLIRSVLHEIKQQTTIDQLTAELQKVYTSTSNIDEN